MPTYIPLPMTNPYPVIPSFPPPPRRQDSGDSYSGRRRQVQFDQPLVRRDTDDSMDSRDSRRHYSHHRAFDDAYEEHEQGRRHGLPLSDILEVSEDLSLSDSSSSTDTEDYIDLEAQSDRRQTDDVLRERILNEYTSPTATGAGNVSDVKETGVLSADPVEPNVGEEAAAVKATPMEGARDGERGLTASPAPLHPESQDGAPKERPPQAQVSDENPGSL